MDVHSSRSWSSSSLEWSRDQSVLFLALQCYIPILGLEGPAPGDSLYPSAPLCMYAHLGHHPVDLLHDVLASSRYIYKRYIDLDMDIERDPTLTLP